MNRCFSEIDNNNEVGQAIVATDSKPAAWHTTPLQRPDSALLLGATGNFPGWTTVKNWSWCGRCARGTTVKFLLEAPVPD